MEKKNCSEMSNAELKMYSLQLKNMFEVKKAEAIKICKEMEEIESENTNVENELKIRKNAYL